MIFGAGRILSLFIIPQTKPTGILEQNTPDAFWFKQPWGYSNFYPWAGGSVFRGASTEGCWNLNMMMARDASWSMIWEIGATRWMLVE